MALPGPASLATLRRRSLALLVGFLIAAAPRSAATATPKSSRSAHEHGSAVLARRRSCRRSASCSSRRRSSSSSAPPRPAATAVRDQLIGLVVAAPLLLWPSRRAAQRRRHQRSRRPASSPAKRQVDADRAEATKECAAELKDKGAKEFAEEFDAGAGATPLARLRRPQGRRRRSLATRSAKPRSPPLATGFGLAGGLGLVVALFYTCLWAMRTGLLTRFWARWGWPSASPSCSASSSFALHLVHLLRPALLGCVPAADRRPGRRAKRSPGRRRARKPPAEPGRLRGRATSRPSRRARATATTASTPASRRASASSAS